MFKVSPASLQTFIGTRLTLTPSVIPNSNYVIMVRDLNCLKYFCVYHQVHKDCTLHLVHINYSNTTCSEDPTPTSRTAKTPLLTYSMEQSPS
jgi:hypothetical protein